MVNIGIINYEDYFYNFLTSFLTVQKKKDFET